MEVINSCFVYLDWSPHSLLMLECLVVPQPSLMLKLLLLHQPSAGGEELGLLVSSTAGSTVFFCGGERLTELYIDLYVNLICLSVWLFLSNKRQNDWTDWAQILCGVLRDPREGLWMIKILKICVSNFFIFVKFWKYSKKILWNPQTFFVFVLYCSKRRCSQIKPQLKFEIEDFWLILINYMFDSKEKTFKPLFVYLCRTMMKM